MKQFNSVFQDKCMTNQHLSQVINNKNLVDFLNIWFKSVKSAENQISNDVKKNTLFYSFRNTRAVNFISKIKEQVIFSMHENYNLYRSIKLFRSHGVEYFLYEGKFLICFKKMNAKGIIYGLKTQRLEDSLDGTKKVHYSKKMMNNLSELGIHKPLPIFYIGYISDRYGNVKDVRFSHYLKGEVDFEVSLKLLFTTDMFSDDNNTNDETKVSPKLKKNKGNKDVA